jgi:predicted CXXCH cytochrome family protein
LKGSCRDAHGVIAKCLECHGGQGKGKSVHTAMSTGCTSCHEIRVNKDITRVKLITATPVCALPHLPCGQESGRHQGDGASARGSRLPDLPRSAHERQQESAPEACLGRGEGEPLPQAATRLDEYLPAKGSRHAALDAGCDTCHVTHKTGAEPTMENRFHLTKAAPGALLDCHDAKDADLQKAHQNQPFATANCLECHDPHQSASPKLMAKFQHAPFEAKSCDTCHAPAKDGKVVLTQADAKSLCVTCHDDKAKLIDTAKVPHPGAAGDCTDCHSPHASQPARLPKTDWSASAWDATATSTICARSRCTISRPLCRAAPPATRLTAATSIICCAPKGNALCLECHGPDSVPQRDGRCQHLLTIFNGTVKLPDDYYKKNKVADPAAALWPGAPGGVSPGLRRDGPGQPKQGEDAAQLSLLPSAARFGSARSAGEGSGEQHGILRQLPQEQNQHERDCFPWTEITGDRDASLSSSIRSAPQAARLLLLLALGLASRFRPSFADKKKKADTTAATEAGPRKFLRPHQAGVAEPAQHCARAMAGLFCRAKDRLHSGKPPPSPRQPWMDRLAGGQSDEKFNPKTFPFQLIGPYGIAIDSKGLSMWPIKKSGRSSSSTRKPTIRS